MTFPGWGEYSAQCKEFFTYGYRLKGGGVTQNSIRELREQAGLTQDELARRLRVTRQTVNAIENDRYNPTLELAFRLASVFGTKIESIFSWKGDE